MRLTPDQRHIITEEVARVFGPRATVRLFGSRVDDAVRGGDIDLHVDADGTPDELLNQELQLRARLMRRLGERRIDVVVRQRGQPQREIDRQALRTGIAL